MKRNATPLVILALSMLLFLFSCKKEEVQKPVTPDGSEFKWIDDTGESMFADSSFFNSDSNKIVAYKDGEIVMILTFQSINISGYPIDNQNRNGLVYTKSDSVFIATAGDLVITKNQNEKLSGSFNVTGESSFTVGLTGEFNNVFYKK